MSAQDVYQLRVVGYINKQLVENTLYFQNTGTAINPLNDAKALVTGWLSNNQAAYLACISSDYVLAGYRARRVNNGGGPTYLAPDGVTAGTYAGATTVTGAGALLGFPFIGSGYPKRQNNVAKIFMPGAPVGGIIDNIIQAALKAALNALITALLNQITGGGSQSYQFGTYRRASAVFNPLVVGDISFTIGTQRRRYKPVI
jgi:hypothetical protein